MDSKNVIAAIALSSAVIVLYSLFFAPEQTVSKKKISWKKQNRTKYWHTYYRRKENHNSNFKGRCFKRK